MGLHARQRITAMGNDIASSLPSSVLHAGLFTLHLHTYIRISCVHVVLIILCN